ncbi:hypothetical protein APHAL10511_003278 [Amanita phalloides]|nr:hypothetical protein APHAL10511_003278 [Amanita phalloides]
MSTERKGIAIVTGSAGAIGQAIATRLAEDGYDVVLGDVPKKHDELESLASDIRAKGRKAIVVVGDVTVESDVKTLVETAVQELGGLDVMVANAGVFFGGPFLESTVENFDTIFAVNVRGTYLCFRYAAEQMIKQGRGGRLLAASSVAGLVSEAFVAFYCSTKWAVRGLVASVAKEVGRHGITVNAYAPGIVAKTPLWEDVKSKIAEGMGLQDADDVDKAETMNTAVGYLGKVEDVSNLVSFLVKKDSHFITGQTISVNGGRFAQ